MLVTARFASVLTDLKSEVLERHCRVAVIR